MTSLQILYDRVMIFAFGKTVVKIEEIECLKVKSWTALHVVDCNHFINMMWEEHNRCGKEYLDLQEAKDYHTCITKKTELFDHVINNCPKSAVVYSLMRRQRTITF